MENLLAEIGADVSELKVSEILSSKSVCLMIEFEFRNDHSTSRILIFRNRAHLLNEAAKYIRIQRVILFRQSHTNLAAVA